MPDPKTRIAEIEAAQLRSDFWNDSQKAQAMIKELQELRDVADGKGKFDWNNSVISIVASVRIKMLYCLIIVDKIEVTINGI